MKIRILGAHNLESRKTRCTAILINERLAVDAGSLTSSLSFDEQARLEALVITHRHMDHVRDLPGLGLFLRIHGGSVAVHSTTETEDALRQHLLNGVIYPRLYEADGDRPPLELRTMSAGDPFEAAGCTILPLGSSHVEGTVGLRITDPEGASVYFTSDTGPYPYETRSRLEGVTLIITEVTMSDEYKTLAIDAGHMTPELLQNELEAMRKQGWDPLPRVIAAHMDSSQEPAIRGQLTDVSQHMNVRIDIGYAGMELEL